MHRYTHLRRSVIAASSAPRFSARAALLDTENAFRVGPHILAAEGRGQRVIRCNLGEPDFPLPRHIAEEVKRQIDAGATGYADPQGMRQLREAIARSMGESRKLDLSPDNVVVFQGAKPPIGLCQQTYCDPGDEVIYPSPGFPIYESFTRYVGAIPVPLHLHESSGFAMSAEALEPLITPRTRLIYLNSPSNPTGGVIDRMQMERIAEVVLRKGPPGVRLFSDEIYERILFDGAEHVSIASIPEMQERTILVSGVSKTYAWTGGRIGWAVFPTAEEAAVFKNLNINYTSSLPPYNQLGAVAALTSPESDVAVAEMVAAFEERRDLMVDALNRIPGISCLLPRGAFYVFPNISGVCAEIGAIEAFESMSGELRDTTSPSTLFQLFLLYEHGVATLDRRAFGKIGAQGHHYLRISIANSLAELGEAAERIAEAVVDRDGFARFIAAGLWRGW